MATISPWTGAGDAVSQQVRQRIVDQLTFAQKQQDMDLAQRRQAMLEQEAQQRADEHQANMASLAEQRSAGVAKENEQRVNLITGRLSIGQNLKAPDAESLPSYLTAPQGVTPPAAPASIAEGDQAAELPGTVANSPSIQARNFRYVGTPAQQDVQQQKQIRGRILSDPNLTPQQRLAIEAEGAGLKVPPNVWEQKPLNTTDGSYTLNGHPIVGLKTNGRVMYRGQDVTDQVTPFTPPQTQGSTDNRLDRSYQYHRTALDKVAQPLEQQQQKIGELTEIINQGTPQADSLVAPKLLSIMAGGQGSGLRMNEAEISRIVGGRSNWENLRAAAQRWSLDPSTANSITPEQRKQVRDLVAAVATKGQKALAITNEAGDALVDAPDVMGHRRVLADTKKRLQQLYEAGGDAVPGNRVEQWEIGPDGVPRPKR